MMHNLARDMTKVKYVVSRLGIAITRFRRRFIPYMVFHGQEVNVRLTWRENKLRATSPEQALKQLNSGHLFEVERMISDIGISFDKGIGLNGRDWEMDWSLDGPINISFQGPCKTKEKRR